MTIQTLLAQQAKQKYKEYLEKVPELRRYQIERYTMLFFTFTALIVFILFAISPTVGTIINLRKQLKDSLFVETQVNQKITALNALENQYRVITPDLPLIYSAVPHTSDAPIFFAEVQALVVKENVSLISIQADSVPLTFDSTVSKQMQLPFTVTVEGTYPNVMNFFSDISTNSRIITPSDVSITKSDNGKGAVQLVIDGQAYFKP